MTSHLKDTGIKVINISLGFTESLSRQNIDFHWPRFNSNCKRQFLLKKLTSVVYNSIVIVKDVNLFKGSQFSLNAIQLQLKKPVSIQKKSTFNSAIELQYLKPIPITKYCPCFLQFNCKCKRVLLMKKVKL